MYQQRKIDLSLLNATAGDLATADGETAITFDVGHYKPVMFELKLVYAERGEYDPNAGSKWGAVAYYTGVANRYPEGVSLPPHSTANVYPTPSSAPQASSGTLPIVTGVPLSPTAFKIVVDSNTNYPQPVRYMDWYAELTLYEIDN